MGVNIGVYDQTSMQEKKIDFGLVKASYKIEAKNHSKI